MSIPDEISLNRPIMIHYNGITKFFVNCKYSDSVNNIQLWAAFGMKVNTNNSMVSFIIENAPVDTAIIACPGDYHFPIPKDLSSLFKRCLLITRYHGIPDSIVIPGDDNFFKSPNYYLPKKWLPFDERINEVFWRGSCTAKERKNIVLQLKDIEGANVKLIRNILWEQPYSEYPELFAERCDVNKQSEYKIWLSIEGWGCASDTTRALMSGCAVIYFRRTAPWFDKYLKHQENCMIIDDNDIDTLKLTIKRMIEDTEFTKKIAENGKKTADEIFQPEFYKKFILNQLDVEFRVCALE